MDMYESEKNMLEKLADAIPGLKGYREKESRRDTDKRFREYLARRIDSVRNGIEEIKKKQVKEGNLDGLDDWDRLSQKLMKVSNSILYASYGYSGFFDQVKIDEGELDRIYQHDLSLLGEVEALENALKNDESLLEVSISALEKRIEDRKNLFTTTG